MNVSTLDNVRSKRSTLSGAKCALLERRLDGKNRKSGPSLLPKSLDLTPLVFSSERSPQKNNPLSFAQERLWILCQLEPNAAYNIPLAFRIHGQLNQEILEQCLNEIIRRHEALRTRFDIVQGRAVQIIDPFAPLKIQLEDLTFFDPLERQARAMNICREDARLLFDLKEGSAMRVKLFRLDTKDHILSLNIHHVASDGWSMGVFISELSSLYVAFSQGRPSPLPELPVRYADFAAWQRQWLQGKVLEKQLTYWKKQLHGAPALLDLPADRPRPPFQSYNGALISGQLPEPLVKALKALSRAEGSTLFMALLAAFQTLLHRYTGSEDILVGTPVAGRNYVEIEQMIGIFINTLVMRGDLSGHPSFRTLLRRTRDAVLDAYANQDLPFEKLVEELRPQRETAHAPIFQVLFALHNTPEKAPEWPGLEVSPVDIDNGTSKFDLSLMLKELDGVLHIVAEYSTDLFDASTIRRMLGHYQTLLEGIISSPDEPVYKLPLLTESERRQITLEWNDTETDYPKDRCLHELVEEQVNRTPGAVAVLFEGKQLTYRELDTRANQLARYLQKLGVGPDVLVGLCMDRSLEMVVGLMGILKAGGAYVPLDPQYPKERLAFMLEDSAVMVLLTQACLIESLPASNVRVICMDDDWPAIAAENEDTVNSAVNAEHLAYMIYTSGSTGRPKGATNTHRGIVNRLLWMQEAYQLTPADRILQKTPFSFDVSVWEFFWPLLAGAELVMARPGGHKDAAYLSQVIAQEKITTVHFVPSMLQVFLQQEALPASCSSLKRVICSGEPLPSELHRRFFSVLDAELHNLYGPTEASVDVTFWQCRPQAPSNVVPIGKPIANTQIYILDTQLQPVPIGVPGELHIGGIGLARGYHNRRELTAEKFIANPFSASSGARLYKTGDLARYLPDGNIEYLGRLDHQVKIRGFRVELGEIEAVLNQHHAVRASVVIAREDTPGDKRLVAYLVDRSGGVKSSELREYLRVQLPDYMMPAAFVTLKALPLSPNGKVERKALPAPVAEDIEINEVCREARTYVEQVLCHIWHAWPDLKRAGIRDNFFDLGGHSLQMIRIIDEINRTLKVHLNVPIFFRNPTIEQLAGILEQEYGIKPEPRVIALQSGTRPGSLFMIEAGTALGLCRLADSIDLGISSFATVCPVSAAAWHAASLDRVADFPTLEEFALPHAMLIQSRYSEPCWLAGHCLGGLLAFEVARQLQEKGLPVEGIFLLDAWGKMPPPPFLDRLKRLTLNRAMQYFRDRVKHCRNKILPATPRMATPEIPGAMPESYNPLDFAVIWKIFCHARNTYHFRALRTRAVEFRASEIDPKVAYLYESDGEMGWTGLFGEGLEVAECPGDHLTMLKAPHLQVLAQQLQTRMRRSKRFAATAATASRSLR